MPVVLVSPEEGSVTEALVFVAVAAEEAFAFVAVGEVFALAAVGVVFALAAVGEVFALAAVVGASDFAEPAVWAVDFAQPTQEQSGLLMLSN